MRSERIVGRASRTSWKVLAASALVVGLVAAGAAPASATTVELSGTQVADSVVHWNTERHNTHAQNSVYVAEDENTAGGSVVVGLRNTSGTQFASGTAAGTTFHVVYNNNGAPYQPAGYFYINTRATGVCGGSGVCNVKWKVNFHYNETYTAPY